MVFFLNIGDTLISIIKPDDCLFDFFLNFFQLNNKYNKINAIIKV